MLVYIPTSGNGSLGQLYHEAKALAAYMGRIGNWESLAAENPEILATIKDSLCDMLADERHLVITVEVEDGKLIATVDELKSEIT